jgi:hypothetical protein
VGQCTVSDLTTIMSYVQSKGIPVRTVGQVIGARY